MTQASKLSKQGLRYVVGNSNEATKTRANDVKEKPTNEDL